MARKKIFSFWTKYEKVWKLTDDTSTVSTVNSWFSRSMSQTLRIRSASISISNTVISFSMMSSFTTWNQKARWVECSDLVIRWEYCIEAWGLNRLTERTSIVKTNVMRMSRNLIEAFSSSTSSFLDAVMSIELMTDVTFYSNEKGKKGYQSENLPKFE